MELRWLEAEVGEGVAQQLLSLHYLGQLTGQRLSQLDHILVLSLVFTEQLDLRLQLQVHGLGAAAQLLRQDLPGALQRTAELWSQTLALRGAYAWNDTHNFFMNCDAVRTLMESAVHCPNPSITHLWNTSILTQLKNHHIQTQNLFSKKKKKHVFFFLLGSWCR